jgi:hypothetical protein
VKKVDRAVTRVFTLYTLDRERDWVMTCHISRKDCLEVVAVVPGLALYLHQRLVELYKEPALW